MTRSSHGLQHLLESKAAFPAFLIAAVCVMARGATFWSGGAFTVAGLLGPAGLRWFNGVTGVGIAVGAELLTSVFGRQWLRAEADKSDAAGRRGMRKSERDALCGYYAFHAFISKAFMIVGIVASTAAAFMFLLTSTGVRDWAILGELVIALVLVVIMTGFGVFYQDRPDADASDVQTGQARTLRAGAVAAAGERIQRGDYTPQDVRLVAGALPRAERDAFEAALITDSPDDPIWTTTQLAEWLGCDDAAGRRRLVRTLGRLKANGAGILKDERTGWKIPRSVVAMHFAGEYLKGHAARPLAVAGRTPAGQSVALAALEFGPDADVNPTISRLGQASARQTIGV